MREYDYRQKWTKLLTPEIVEINDPRGIFLLFIASLQFLFHSLLLYLFTADMLNLYRKELHGFS